MEGYKWETIAKNMGFDICVIKDCCYLYCEMHTSQTLLGSIENDYDRQIYRIDNWIITTTQKFTGLNPAGVTNRLSSTL